MVKLETSALQLVENYRETLRPFIAEQSAVAPQTLAALDQSAELIELACKRKARLEVGFVGESQVGKSSLINALLGRFALPAGGIGPLTASATRVRHAADGALEVRYHDKIDLHQLAFGIERHLIRQGLSFAPEERTTAPEGVDKAAMGLEDAAEDSVPGSSAAIAAPEVQAEISEKMQYMIHQGRRLLAGGPSPNPEGTEISDRLVLEGLRSAMGQKVRCDPALLTPYRERIAEIQRRLGTRERIQQSSCGGLKEFDRELRLRASGWLAPLVAKLEVAIDAKLVRSLTVTDLPGIGVVGDPAAQVAEKYVHEEGDALVVVMRNSGMTASLARLLEQTGVITRLLFGGREGRTPVHVLIAVTHLDDVVRSRCQQASAEYEDGTELPSPDAWFRQEAEEMQRVLRAQLGAALRDSSAFEGLEGELRQRREKVVDDLCRALVIECVAAPDFMDLKRPGAFPQPLLRDPETTGIPVLRRHLVQMAHQLTESRSRAISEAKAALETAIGDHLSALESIYADGGGQAQVAWDSFREDLDQYTVQLKPEMAAHHGEALGSLRQTIPMRIELICKNAQQVAMKQLKLLRRRGDKLHFQSLNAALRYKGVWGKREIDYPGSLTRALVDAIAGSWEPEVVDALRKLMREVAESDIALVDRLCERAREHDSRIVVDAQIDAQKRVLQQQSRTAVAWTRERLETLREDVQRELQDKVAEPIGEVCEAAIRAGKNQRTGAKNRVLEALEDGGEKGIDKAASAAHRLLSRHYVRLVAELQAGYLKEHHDPVQAAYEALTSQELARARRSDAQKRKRVLDAVAQMRALLGKAEQAVEVVE